MTKQQDVHLMLSETPAYARCSASQDFALHALHYQPTYCNALGSCYTVDHYAK